MANTPITWDASLILGNATIDTQHRHLFEVFERLRNVTSGQDKLQESATCISEMMRYVNTHFADEEAYMQSIGFEGLNRHKGLHAEFVGKVADYADACGSGYAPYADMLEYLVKWLSEHIMVEDMTMVAVAGGR